MLRTDPAVAAPDRVLVAATALSGIATLLGGGFLTGLVPNFYVGGDYSPLADLIGSRPTTVLHTLFALLGTAAGIVGLAGRLNRAAIVTAGVLQAAVFGIVMGSLGTLSAVGYLVAFCMPVVVVGLLVQVIRRQPRLRWTVGVPALGVVAAALILAGAGLPDAVRTAGSGVAGKAWQLGMVLLLLVTAAVWAAVAVRAAAAGGGLDRATAWVLRHRTAITVVAATGPLPYALIRLTWLTPWPAGVDEGVPMTIRVWGLLLSSGAWAGVFLTLGLIRPWGEIFPRWVPGLAGRVVPIAAVAVPGGLVAATVTFSAVPILSGFMGEGLVDSLLGALMIPCWYWGPALALAVWGYVAHRQAQARG
ncbi:hypothetical protein [Myceligenerans pegani]|uniref:Integral membrane protein n=1 Tax=Myceligenerans pegani TaxID=2776917 RepID=A0ABR9MTG2_9MICO|nr:hypothetical protein [Myceligenerans sp. TRM 65318]MBE1874346.1 hypothetical protein [Myceligenerans sp. TRM 65318]MBE3016617.1 hypothetical protein [Myceligenerans sp. TRM 65318]